MAVLDEENVSTSPRGGGPLAFLFRSCNPDPKGSVHRAWSVTMLLTLIFFILAIIEDASVSLTVAAIWTAIIQFGMIVVGTFIIKRFSTSFSVGFLLGLVIVVAQQYLLLAVTFWHNEYGSWAKNVAFANLAFGLAIIYSFFALILFHFKESIMVAAVDAKGLKRPSAKSEAAGVAGGVNA